MLSLVPEGHSKNENDGPLFTKKSERKAPSFIPLATVNILANTPSPGEGEEIRKIKDI